MSSSFIVKLLKTSARIIVVSMIVGFICVLVPQIAVPTDAQATPLVVKAAGSITANIQGILITQSLFLQGNQTLALYVPFIYTNVEIGNAVSTDALCLVYNSYDSAQALLNNIIWNFTQSESDTIKAWLKTAPRVRNNLNVLFSATWDSNGRFAITTSAWNYGGISLIPYTMGAGCNISSFIAATSNSKAALPASCLNQVLPGVKQNMLLNPQCALLFAVTESTMNYVCNIMPGGRTILTTYYCSDGAAAVTALCDFAVAWQSDGGVSSSGPVFQIGTDALPIAGRLNQMPVTVAPSSAHAVSIMTSLVFSILCILCF